MQVLQASAAGHEFGWTCAPDGLGATCSMRVRPRLSQPLSDGAHAVAAVVAAGPAGSRGWAHSFSAASFRILKRGGVALKAGSRALPVAALRPRPKYVLFDCYAGAHSCLAAMEHRCATRRSALRGTLVCLGTLGLLVCLDTLGLLVCVDTLGRTTAFWPLARPPWLPRSNGEAFAGKPCPLGRPARSVSVHRGDGDAQCSVLSCRQKRPLRRSRFFVPRT